MLKSLFAGLKGKGKGKGKKKDLIGYEESKRMLNAQDPKTRLDLAERDDMRPEVLYYLAGDEDAGVRRAIAENEATPVQADIILARDVDEEVRSHLARKIGRLLPSLTEEQQESLREKALEVLDILARDQLPRVRAILSEELKNATNAPKDLLLTLARDVEAIVAAPVLEYSPLLSDNDLLELVASGVAPGALPAIARRENLGETLADAIANSLDTPTVAALLANPSARIREETLDHIIDHAGDVESWHEPLVMKVDLSVRAIRRIAGFVASSLVDRLVEHHDLPNSLESELKEMARARIRERENLAEADEVEARLGDLIAAGRLDHEALAEAIDGDQRRFVTYALAHLAGLERGVVGRILETRDGKAVTALAWKAGLPMRLALKLQTRLARVPTSKMANARGGTDYPFSDDEMAWQIEFFTG